MNSYEKGFLVLAVVLLLVAVAVNVLVPQTPVVPKNETNATFEEGKQLVFFAVNFGRNSTDYAYAYRETSNGYLETYQLVKNGQRRYLQTDDMLSVKKFYFLENSTILCVDYQGSSQCSATDNITDTQLQKYYAYLKGKYLNPDNMAKEQFMFESLFQKGFVKINDVTDATVDGHKCRMVTYEIDYSYMTVDQAGEFGITPTSPKHFYWKICADSKLVYYKYFNYTYNGLPNDWEFKLVQFGPQDDINPPQNLSEDSYQLLIEEMQNKGAFTNCFRQLGDDKDHCVAISALNLLEPRVCALAGGRTDRCYMSLMPLLLNESICTLIQDANFKDDCYIELAGGKRTGATAARLQIHPSSSCAIMFLGRITAMRIRQIKHLCRLIARLVA
ncbi:MAG: hypothetical protein V1492_02260 [Candidatus Micrarchaeota archaeon]